MKDTKVRRGFIEGSSKSLCAGVELSVDDGSKFILVISKSTKQHVASP